MWLSMLGILIASITAIVSALTEDDKKSKRRKASLVLLAIVGLAVGLYAAVASEQEAVQTRTKLSTIIKEQKRQPRASLHEGIPW
jgi:uncharacterized membrane protein